MSWTGIPEIDAWVEEQREENSRRFYRLLDEQRSIWTPRDVFKVCCVKWLADGMHEYDEYSDPYDVRGGCHGNCHREHPTVTISFRDGRTVAEISHRLDPFLKYFEDRCRNGSAEPFEENSWKLDGFLRENVTALKNYSGFGSHLICVAQSDINASDQAHKRKPELEDSLHQKKKARITEAPAPELVRAALEVCCKNGLGKHLDLVEIAWLRTLNHAVSKMAAPMANDRLQNVKLSYTVFLDGKLRVGGEVPLTLTDDVEYVDTEEAGGYYDDEGIRATVYKAATDRNLALHSPNDGPPHIFTPDDEDQVFEWDSGFLEEAEEPGEDWRNYPDYVFDYSGNKICLFLEPLEELNADGPARTRCVKIGEFHIGKSRFETGILERESLWGARSRVEIVECHTERRPGRIIEAGSSSDGSSDESEVEESRAPDKVRYTGRFSLLEVSFDFGGLVGYHAREKLKEQDIQFQQTQRERPLKDDEQRYLTALQTAVAKSPGGTLRWNTYGDY